MGYGKTSRIPYANVQRASRYLQRKGVKSAFMFGSGLKVANPKHDLDVAVSLPFNAQNKRKFADASDEGIDLFLLENGDSENGSLYSVGCGDFLYTDEGELQGLEEVGAKKFSIMRDP
jgi:predicted nucleotidyltransferase